MKNILLLFALISLQINAQFTNVQVGNQNYPNEPAIVINPNDTNKMFAASNTANYYISGDAGATWSENVLTSSLGVWGDPSLIIDNAGDFYFFHLSYPSGPTWLDRIVCQKSTDNGITFNDGTYFGLNGTKDQDKEWVTIDRNNGNIYVTWTEFDDIINPVASDLSRIMFVKSTDNAQTWSTPVKINEVDGDCYDEDDTVEGAVPAIGPNGEIYTAWAGPAGIVFDKSTDYGQTWLANDILVDPMSAGWSFDVPGIDRCNGLPVTACDISGGTYNGTIYVNWTDQRNGTNDTDVWLKKSTDGGNTWSPIKRVNDDPIGNGKQQFLTWMDIDQTNGNIYIVFYDRRNHNDNSTDVYMARSTDGGDTFQNMIVSDTSFLPDATVFFGDYTNISAHNGVIRPIWNRLHNGNSSIWTALINDNDIVTTNDYFNETFDLQQNYPNPAKDETYVSFKLKKSEIVSLSIYNLLGNEVLEVLDNQQYESGKHIIKIPLTSNKLTSGVYFYKLKIGNKAQTKKMIVE